jgi:glycosyltransferase involved in cell wall biosynthesis
MSNRTKQEQKRKQKKQDQRRIETMARQLNSIDKTPKNIPVPVEAVKSNSNPKIVPDMEQRVQSYPDPLGVVNYIADRNGCGYYRCIWPFELLATYKGLITMNSYAHLFEPSYLLGTQIIRFQRQATTQQKQAWDMYRKLRGEYNFKYQLQYEIDDYLMGIEPDNVIAYNFFDKEKKDNHMHMLRTADRITFSTETLKNVYVEQHGIPKEKISVIRNTIPQFLYNLPPRMRPNEFSPSRKPRILWSGSGSHVGPNGDLTFLIDMIKKTVNEYQWIFQGVIPEELRPYVNEKKIEFIPWCATYGLANMQFYVARPDICIAPLKPSFFNTCKSDLKILEYSALGAPCISTSFLSTDHGKSPYEDTAEICLDPDPDIWKAAIDHLISDQDYYMECVRKGYNHLNSRWMENALDAWLQAIDYKIPQNR